MSKGNLVGVDRVWEQVLAGVDVGEDVKRMLMGLYTINFYKVCWELLLGLVEDRRQFMEKTDELVSQAIEALSGEKRRQFDELIGRQKVVLMSEIMREFTGELPEEAKKRIEANVKRLAAES